MREENAERIYKVMFVKQKSGSYTARLTLPKTMLSDLGIKAGDSVQYERVENGILIKRC